MFENECKSDTASVSDKAFSTTETNLDRQAIREARKERNKLKKLQKQREKEKQRALKLYEQSLDKNVTIITRDFAEKFISNSSSTLHHSTDIYNVSDQDFPSLEAQKTKISKKTNSNQKLFVPITTCIEKPIQVHLSEIIDRNLKTSVKFEKPKNSNNILRYEGNDLDSSRPERRRGKHKETVAKKRTTSLKKNILVDTQRIGDHPISYKAYCDHLITNELNDDVANFLKTIVRFQENLFKRDPIRGKSKRRYVVGFHEVKKNLLLNRVKLLIMAPDIKVIENGALDLTVNELLQLAKTSAVPYVFALKRRVLAKLLKIPVPVSAVGINNYSSLEVEFQKIVDETKPEQTPIEDKPVQKLEPCSQVILEKLIN